MTPAQSISCIAATLLLAACSGGDIPKDGILVGNREQDINPGLPPMSTIAPENTADGWQTSTPAAQSIDEAVVLGIFDSFSNGQYPKVDSIVVVRNDRLVAEGYFNGYGRESLHDTRSTGKSVTSALAGIAVEQGLMRVEDPISQHIPDFESHDNVDSRKRAISVQNLLDMSSGFDCDDSVPSSPGNEINIYEKHDWVKFVLDLRMTFDPGSRSEYCTGGVIVLGSMISYRSGMGLDDFAATWLFAPLDIRAAGWLRAPDRAAVGGGGVQLRPRDMAKFGNLYLDGGVWNGQRVLPAAWVAESRRVRTTIDGDGYGYLWWKRSFTHGGATLECFYTSGNGGNYIFVIPALELVVAFTGSNFNSPAGNRPVQIVAERLLPGVH